MRILVGSAPGHHQTRCPVRETLAPFLPLTKQDVLAAGAAPNGSLAAKALGWWATMGGTAQTPQGTDDTTREDHARISDTLVAAGADLCVVWPTPASLPALDLAVRAKAAGIPTLVYLQH